MRNYVFNVKKNTPDIIRKIYIALPFTLLSLIIDRISKILVLSNMNLYQSIPVLDNFFKITYVTNPYAAFSIKLGNYWLMMILTFISVILILIYFFKIPYKVNESIAFGLIIGGAFGNIYDRLKYREVVDMLDFGIGRWRFATFNFADTSVVIGVCLIILFMILDGKKK